MPKEVAIIKIKITPFRARYLDKTYFDYFFFFISHLIFEN
jgi:hypothetical protein